MRGPEVPVGRSGAVAARAAPAAAHRRVVPVPAASGTMRLVVGVMSAMVVLREMDPASSMQAVVCESAYSCDTGVGSPASVANCSACAGRPYHCAAAPVAFEFGTPAMKAARNPVRFPTLTQLMLPIGAQDATEAEVKAFVKEHLAPYKYPRFIEFVSELPKTATGKIQRFRLREKEAAGL